MDLRSLLSLIRVAVTFLIVITGAQMGVCFHDEQSNLFPESQKSQPQRRLTLNNEHLVGNGAATGGNASSKSNNEEETDDIVSSGPTDNPLDFSRAENKLNMSFGQAIVLAREEAKCLSEFGSQKYKTVLANSTNRVLDDEFIVPFGCYKSETTAQCEQCKNVTARPISSVDCRHLCTDQDGFCNHTCFRVSQALKNESGGYDDAHKYNRMITDMVESLKKSNSSSLTEYEVVRDNITKTIYTTSPTDNVNGSDSVNNVGRGNPLTFFPSSMLQQAGQLIDSPQIFCEAVNYLDDKRRLVASVVTTDSLSADNGKTTTTYDPASLKTHFILLKWNVNVPRRAPIPNVSWSDKGSTKSQPLIFVIEQQTGNSSEWKTIGKTPFGLQAVNVSYLSEVYRWRITAVGPKGIEDVAVTDKYVTLDGYKEPGPPKEISVVETEIKNNSVNVLIGWEPPAEKACFYKIVLDGSSGVYGKSVRIKDRPLGVHKYWFEDLSFGTVYHVRVTSRNLKWHGFESNLTKLEFRTPTCLEAFNYRFDKCAPPSPRDIKVDIQRTKEQQNFKVSLSWLPPQNTTEENPIVEYEVEISPFNIQALPKLNATQTFRVAGNTTKLSIQNLELDKQYTVMIRAFSVRGGSPRAQYHLSTKLAIKPEVSRESGGHWIYVTVTFTLAAVLLLVCNAMRIYVHKRNVKKARNQYFQSMEERDEMGADWSIVPLTDDSSNWKLFDENFPKEKWEISWDELTMAEVIGQGAFGVVRRAKLHRKKLEAKLKFRGEDETWFNSADRNVDETDPEMETVAVKMVKGKVSSTRDDREHLIKEITMMQNLGFHSQIVGLLGACTKGRTLCLVLEFCPGGDLLTFIRKVRAKYWPTLGLSESKDRNSPFGGKRSTTAPGMTFCGGTISGSVGTFQKSNGSSSISDNRKSCDSSPINYADIGGFSLSSSSPENSSPGEGDNGKRDLPYSGNSVRTENNSLPPLFVNGSQQDEEDEDFRPIDEKDVLSYARQIAMGMEYLEKNRVVHRDLACRNILLMGDYKHCKISDFGLSRDIYTWNVYHQKSNGKLPIKWMAIESIFSHVFTSKSDIWSYGILLWELVTLGGTPYPGLGNTELFHLLKSGYRMERPDNCSEELFAVMKKCWRTAAASRPNFTELRRHVETMMEAAEPNLYLSLMADLPVDYFQLSSRSDIPLVGKEDESLATPLRDSPMGATNSLFNSRHNSSSKNGTSDYGSTKSNTAIPGSSHSSSRRKTHSLYHNTSYAHHHHHRHHHHHHHKGNESIATSPSVTTTDCNCGSSAGGSGNMVNNSVTLDQGESCSALYQNKEVRSKEEPEYSERKSRDYPVAAASSTSRSSTATLVGCDPQSKQVAQHDVSSGGTFTGIPGNSPIPQPLTTSNATTLNNSCGSSKLIREKGLLRLSLDSRQQQQNHQQGKMMTENQQLENEEWGTAPIAMDREKLLSQDSEILINRARGGLESVQYASEEQVSLVGDAIEHVTDNNEEKGIADRETEKSHLLTTYKSRAPSPPPTQIAENLPSPCRSMFEEEQKQNSSAQSPTNGTSPYSLCCSTNGTQDSTSGLAQQSQQQTQAAPPLGKRQKPKLTLPFVNINDMTIIENRSYDLPDV